MMIDAINASGSSGQITREMLFHLMALARDVSFLDAEMRAIAESVTYEKVNDTIDLLRRLHALKSSSAAAGNVKMVQSVTSQEPVGSTRRTQTSDSQLPKLSIARACSEPGAVLCAATFYTLCKEDCDKLQKLSAFCPFSLAYQQCFHGKMCQLKHICWLIICKRRSCFQSHEVLATCNYVFDGTRCPRTERILGNNKKKACPSNHDFKTRLFMGAMRTPHRLGFYGVRANATATEEPEASFEASLTGDTMSDPVDSVVATESEDIQDTVADHEPEYAAYPNAGTYPTADLIQFP